jgi:hypothetical protein
LYSPDVFFVVDEDDVDVEDDDEAAVAASGIVSTIPTLILFGSLPITLLFAL